MLGRRAYSNADINQMALFIGIAQKHGFDYNYTYGRQINHMGNNNQSLHKDHFHMGTNYARSNSNRLRYGRGALIDDLCGELCNH